MATEVSCGQCQGRLLVETLGIVVACPHCGTHLSIPLPTPEPVLAPPPAVEQTPMVEASASVSPLVAGLTASDHPAGSGTPTLEDSSVFTCESEDSADPGQVGWPSAPNLSLASEGDQTSADRTAAPSPVPPQPLFTAPLMNRDDSQTVLIPPVPPVLMFDLHSPSMSAEQASVPGPTMFDLSGSQQFTLGSPADFGDAVNAATQFVTPPPSAPSPFRAGP